MDFTDLTSRRAAAQDDPYLATSHDPMDQKAEKAATIFQTNSYTTNNAARASSTK